ncbi:hypothetical protein [Litoribrevibacter albus]|uniref:Lipoprotein n=1 Tax=Litoribrevibacter albus TaxID=1473156 RepID=A0AA37SA89_9GAMM|nr:hypothetical protein [Litoribrevibacter albus]GLQ30963.1 hypothetical protein GCM10007876_14420 [Litoribrevibacter albus]
MKLLKVALLSASVALTAACQTTQENTSSVNAEAHQAQSLRNAELYEVHKDNRIYVFYDHTLYEDFLKHGHTAYMYNRIGAGPKGETLVFGLTKQDKKKREGIPSVELLDGSLPAADDFYAEMHLHGRIYVFSAFQDMAAVRKTGEAAYRHAKIGYGPNGETVVFVLNKGNKKKYPEALVNKFDTMNGKS